MFDNAETALQTLTSAVKAIIVFSSPVCKVYSSNAVKSINNLITDVQSAVCSLTAVVDKFRSKYDRYSEARVIMD